MNSKTIPFETTANVILYDDDRTLVVVELLDKWKRGKKTTLPQLSSSEAKRLLPVIHAYYENNFKLFDISKPLNEVFSAIQSLDELRIFNNHILDCALVNGDEQTELLQSLRIEKIILPQIRQMVLGAMRNVLLSNNRTASSRRKALAILEGKPLPKDPLQLEDFSHSV